MIVKYVGSCKDYNKNLMFSFGKEYQVLADYRNRKQFRGFEDKGVFVKDNGFVVVDDRGQHNMLFENEVRIIEDNKEYYIFNY